MCIFSIQLITVIVIHDYNCRRCCSGENKKAKREVGWLLSLPPNKTAAVLRLLIAGAALCRPSV